MSNIKRLLTMILALMIITCGMTGCGKQDTNTLLIVDNENISQGLYRIFLWSAQRGLESLQVDFWQLDNIEGKSPEEFAKDKALDSLLYCIAVEKKSKELGITLTSEDEKKVKEAAVNAMKENTVLTKDYGVTQKDYERYYTFATQNEKAEKALMESYIPNDREIELAISDLKECGADIDYAIVELILFKTKNELQEDIPQDKLDQKLELANEVLQRALDGENFKSLIAQYSDDASIGNTEGGYKIHPGDMEKVIEDIAFDKANAHTIYPKLLQTERGYIILRVGDVVMHSKDEILQMARDEVKLNFANEDITETIQTLNVEKLEMYNELHVMK